MHRPLHLVFCGGSSNKVKPCDWVAFQRLIFHMIYFEWPLDFKLHCFLVLNVPPHETNKKVGTQRKLPTMYHLCTAVITVAWMEGLWRSTSRRTQKTSTKVRARTAPCSFVFEDKEEEEKNPESNLSAVHGETSRSTTVSVLKFCTINTSPTSRAYQILVRIIIVWCVLLLFFLVVLTL